MAKKAKLINKGSVKFKQRYLGQTIELEPGAHVIVGKSYAVSIKGNQFDRPNMDIKDRDELKQEVNRHIAIDWTPIEDGEELEVYACNKCGKSFENKPLLMNHLEIHAKDTITIDELEKAICPLCDRSFTGPARRSNLKKHVVACAGKEETVPA